MKLPKPGSVLMVIDVQKAVDFMDVEKPAANPVWGERNNLDAEAKAFSGFNLVGGERRRQSHLRLADTISRQ